jgi:glycerate 2-kinase
MAAVRGVSARALVTRALEAERQLVPGDPEIRVIAAGKAAPAMAATFAEVVGAERCRGLVVGSHGDASPGGEFESIQAGHPVPNDESMRAGHRALVFASSTLPAQSLVVLLSGGASALMALPQEGLRLEEKQAATDALLRAGAAIHELNSVRKHLSAIKGGRLAAACPGRVITLAISDVVGPVEDDPSVIGSGPTVGDPTTFAEALASVDRLAQERFPRRARIVLERGAAGRLEETPKPGDSRLAGDVYRVIGHRRTAMIAARAEADRRGYVSRLVHEPVIGEAREAGVEVIRRAVEAAADGPTCVISSGETTVRVVGHGRGGRNQELALGALDAMSGVQRPVLLASVGTDGIDGPTDAAGAVVDPVTSRRAREAGLNARRALDDNDAYHFFDPLNDRVRIGPTDTNVGDVQVVLVL